MSIKNHFQNSYLGAGGSLFSGLCCLGTPIVLWLLSLLGLSFLINDFILFPLLALSLVITLRASYKNKKLHKNKTPFTLLIIIALLLFPALFISKAVAYVLITGLVIVSLWDICLGKKK